MKRKGGHGMKQGRQTVDTRRARILALIRERQKIKVEELSILFGVSLMTIRRDLRALEDTGQIGRFYGGASVEPYAVSVTDTVPSDSKERCAFSSAR